MKTNNMYIQESRLARFPYAKSIKSVILCAFILMGIQSSIQAQDSIRYTKPSWFFGVAAGGNINFYRGSTQKLDGGLTVPTTFQDGSGVGLFVAPLIEYRPATSRFGIMLQVGYDNRRGAFNSVNTPCNCPADLISDLSYLTVEPSLRVAPFKSNFYMYAGPRLAFNLSKGYNYQLGINPAYPNQAPTAAVEGDFSDIRSNLISMQIGAGYDIPLSSQYHKTQWVLSPFVSFQPYFGQDPRTIETWNVTTLRVGAALKLGSGHKIESRKAKEVAVIPEKVIIIADPKYTFTVVAPENVQTDHQVKEVFPLRNYVYFDLGSDKVPSRYVTLTKGQVKDFREDELSMTMPKNGEGRSGRQMKVYYNVLNIVGERMVNNPSATIVLVGSSEQGPKDGRAMAESVKQYLVTVFVIAPSRITTDGRDKPIIPGMQNGGTKELVLLREGDRRVSIETESQALLMEFQSGRDASFKPVEITSAPLDSNVSIDVKGANAGFVSWTLEVADESGKIQNYGPYTQDEVSIPGKTILGNRAQGDYKLTMVGKAKNGNTLRKETTAHIVLWKTPVTETGTRFSILYEFNKSKAIKMYEKYLTNVVTPKIPKNGTVIIHGHTDVIGGEEYNQRLSLARANDVQDIMKDALAKAGRKDVTFEVTGLGEDLKTSPFENKFAEQRSYNRTVIIDIVPQKLVSK